MFGHLNAEDFTNLLEGTVLSERLHNHLMKCGRCRERFDAAQAVRQEISDAHLAAAEYVPEPEWENFRADVRNALLARSVKRDHTGLVSSLGFRLQPSLVWGLSLVLVMGVALGIAFWGERHSDSEPVQTAGIEEFYAEPEAMSSLASVSQTDVFDDLIHLNSDEAENLQSILNDLNTVSEQ